MSRLGIAYSRHVYECIYALVFRMRPAGYWLSSAYVLLLLRSFCRALLYSNSRAITLDSGDKTVTLMNGQAGSVGAAELNFARNVHRTS